MTVTVPARSDARLLSPENIVEIDGEPRICDTRLGAALGFLNARKIRELIERNLAEIETYGPTPRRGAMVEIGSGARREVSEFWLTEPQALLVSMFARTTRAAEVRKALIEAFLAFRAGKALPAPKKRFEGLTFGQATNACAYIGRMVGGDDAALVQEAMDWAHRRLAAPDPARPAAPVFKLSLAHRINIASYGASLAQRTEAERRTGRDTHDAYNAALEAIFTMLGG